MDIKAMSPISSPVRDPEWDNRESPLWKAAKGMEANFMKEMMRNMRKTVDENEADKNNKGLQVFRGMLDDEYAETATRTQGIGLAEIIVKQLLEQNRPQPMNVSVRNLNETDYKKNL